MARSFFYSGSGRIPEKMGSVSLTNCYDVPYSEAVKQLNIKESKWTKECLHQAREIHETREAEQKKNNYGPSAALRQKLEQSSNEQLGDELAPWGKKLKCSAVSGSECREYNKAEADRQRSFSRQKMVEDCDSGETLNKDCFVTSKNRQVTGKIGASRTEAYMQYLEDKHKEFRRAGKASDALPFT